MPLCPTRDRWIPRTGATIWKVFLCHSHHGFQDGCNSLKPFLVVSRFFDIYLTYLPFFHITLHLVNTAPDDIVNTHYYLPLACHSKIPDANQLGSVCRLHVVAYHTSPGISLWGIQYTDRECVYVNLCTGYFILLFKENNCICSFEIDHKMQSTSCSGTNVTCL